MSEDSEGHHRLFDIPEILKEISENLVDDSNGPFHRHDIASVAVFCKAFSGPALDVLWKELSAELPLFKLLPGFQKVGDVWVC
jgi:hypothetical protein